MLNQARIHSARPRWFGRWRHPSRPREVEPVSRTVVAGIDQRHEYPFRFRPPRSEMMLYEPSLVLLGWLGGVPWQIDLETRDRVVRDESYVPTLEGDFGAACC
jgi:hypothetical protein